MSEDVLLGSEKPVFSIEELTEKLHKVRAMGWVPNRRPGNQGGAGNTLEDLLGVKENNFQAPDYGEYELKTHRKGSTYITLFHHEPVNLDFVKNLLPVYGWKHKTLEDEMRISITVTGNKFTGRGFRAVVDRQKRQVYVDFVVDRVQLAKADYREWLEQVQSARLGRSSASTLWDSEIEAEDVLIPVQGWEGPIWPFDVLENILFHKIYNAVVVLTEVKKLPDGKEKYHYVGAKIYRKISMDRFLNYIELGYIYIDFDARTGHNHGIKFRLLPKRLLPLYEGEEVLM